MTAPKHGDRVRVTFEAEVYYAETALAGWLQVAVDDDAPVYPFVPVSACEVIARPLNVGDVVDTAAQLDELPAWSIVRCHRTTGPALAAQKDRLGMWRTIYGAVTPWTITAWQSVVVHIGEDEQ